MAVTSLKDLKKPELIPQHLYTPHIKNEKAIDLRLYTPTIKNNEKLDDDTEVPDIDENKIYVPLYTPVLMEEPFKVPLYTPTIENVKFRRFLIIPNPNEIDIDPGIRPPDIFGKEFDPISPIPNLDFIEISQYIRVPYIFSKLLRLTQMIPEPTGEDISSEIYKIPLKDGVSNYYDNLWKRRRNPINLNVYLYNIINALLVGNGPFSASLKDDNWYLRWMFLEENKEPFYTDEEFIKLLPLKVELPPNSYGKKKTLSLKIPKVKPPKRYFYTKAYMELNNNYKPNMEEDIAKRILHYYTKGEIKQRPYPGFKIPTPPASQGWDADSWGARARQFADDFKNLGSDMLNAGKEALKGLAVDIFAMSQPKKKEDEKKESATKSTDPLRYNWEDDDREGNAISRIKKEPYNIGAGISDKDKSIFDKDKDLYFTTKQTVYYDKFGNFGKEINYISQPVDSVFGEYFPHLYSYLFPRSPIKKSYSEWMMTNSESPKGGVTIARPSKFNSELHPMNLLNAIGPDFMKHKFDAFFIFCDKNGNPIKPVDINEEKWTTDFQKFIFDHKGFAVRFGSINIPASISEEFTVSWLETKVQKVRTKIKNDNRASFTFRLDNNMFWLDLVDKMAGHNNTIDSMIIGSNGIQSPSVGNMKNPFYNNNDTWENAIHYLSNSYHYNQEFKLALIIKMDHLHDYIHTGSQTRTLPYFLFEDIKILGASNNLEYDREGSSTQNMTVDFIFNYCQEIYTPNNLNDAPKFEFTNQIFRNLEGEHPYFSVVLMNGIANIQKRPKITTYEEMLGLTV